MTRTEYLVFEEVEATRRTTRVVRVLSARSGHQLGRIAWYSPWRQYVFYPEADTLWNPECLESVRSSVRSMTDEHRRQLQQRREQRERGQ